MRVFLLGATGYMGRAVLALLARRQEPVDLTLAARNRADLERLTADWRGARARVGYEVLDVNHGDAARAMANHDVVMSCAGPAFETEEAAIRAALAAGVPYASLCDDPGAFAAGLARAGAAREAGVALLLGCGLSPGLTNLLYARAATQLGGVHDATIAVAGAVADNKGPAGIRQLQAAPLDAPAPVYFPDPVGWVETFRLPHPEDASLPHPVEVRFGLTERGAMDVVRATAPAERRRRTLARTLVGAARFLPPRGPAWSGARVDVHGSVEGSPATVTLGVVDRLANVAGGMLVRAAGALAAGKIPPGAYAAHEALDAQEVLTSLASAGVRIARLEPEPL